MYPKLLLAALFSAVTASLAAAESLTVGIQDEAPPFSYIDGSGERTGFDVEIAKALCEELRAECELKETGFAGLIPRLEHGDFDIVVGSLSITDERLQKVDFTNEYYSSPARYVARESRSEELSLSGLRGKFVGVKHGTTFDDFLRANYGEEASIRHYATQDEAILDLVLGRLDAVLGDSIILRESFLEREIGEEFAFVGPSLDDPRWFGRGAGIAVSKGNAELVQRLNLAIESIRRRGRYQEISERFFGYDIYGEPAASQPDSGEQADTDSP